MNRLFYKKLCQYTHNRFELIVIDNGSTDGSREFFESLGQNVRVIANNGNYSYPYCQNQGIRAASHDLFAFLNNDIIVAPEWDKRLMEVMKANGLDIVTPVGMERMENHPLAKKTRRRWRIIKWVVGLFGYSERALSLMHYLMYGDWHAFNSGRTERFGNQVVEGFVGNSVIMTRRAIELIGLWDERIQGADFDLYFRSKERSLSHKDIQPVHIALGVYHHHYIRLTMKKSHPQFRDSANLISFDDKWGKEIFDKYIADIQSQIY
jgi:GT2 family glycosyltransferase